MEIRIFQSPELVAPYIQLVREAADRHRASFGFLSSNVYEYQASAGKLWVAVNGEKYVGHILFGGRYPALRVLQIFAVKEMRGKGVAQRLLESLINYGERHEWLTISAHVASDLTVNSFWEKQGFGEKGDRFIFGGRIGGGVSPIRKWSRHGLHQRTQGHLRAQARR